MSNFSVIKTLVLKKYVDLYYVFVRDKILIFWLVSVYNQASECTETQNFSQSNLAK